MAKGAFVKSLIEMAEKAGLDMSDAARMQRAKEQGFDTQNVYEHNPSYRFRNNEDEISEIREGEDTSFDGIFSNRQDYDPDSDYLKNSFFVKNKLNHDDFSERFYSDKEASDKLIDKNISRFWRLNEDQKDTIRKLITEENSNIYSLSDDGVSVPEWMKGVFSEDEMGLIEWELQKIRGKIAKEFGADAVDMIDETGVSTLLLSKPGGVRSIKAAFDPSKKDSANLMAGIIPGAVGLSSLLGGQQADASQQNAYGLITPDLLSRMSNEQYGSIQAPVNNRAMTAANLAGSYNTMRRERLHPLLDALLPAGELPEELWRKRAYGDDVNWMDYLKAGAGML